MGSRSAGQGSHPLPSAATGPEGLWSLLAAPQLQSFQDTPPLSLVGREDLSSGPHRDSGFASISAKSQQQWARHFLLGHNLETKKGIQYGGRGWSSTSVASYFCYHWIPTIPWVPAALPVDVRKFYLASVCRLSFLPLLGQPITCLWGTHITQLAYVQGTKSRFTRASTLSQDLTIQLA